MAIREQFEALANPPGQGRASALGQGLLVAAAAAGILCLHAFSQFRGLKEPEAMEAAQPTTEDSMRSER